MRWSRVRVVALTAWVAACNGKGAVERPYVAPSVEQLTSQLSHRATDKRSFVSESKMDYWIGNERVRGDVYMMGKPGARLRFNALNPTGGNVAVDLACDGVTYKLIDYNNNCQLTGPCTSTAIAQLFRLRMEPDEFYLLAVGETPVLPDATGELRWDANEAQEIVTLENPAGWKQKIVLDGREQRWDVVESVVWNERGEVEWKVQNKDFREIKGPEASPYRFPGKTRFEQPTQDADLLVDWRSIDVNTELGEERFEMEIPEGLPRCK